MRRAMIAGMMLAGTVGLAGCGGAPMSEATPQPTGPVTAASCHADTYQNLVGKPVVALQNTALVMPANVRIYQTGSPIPEGVVPARLNFVFDSRRVITQVHCG